MRRRPLLGALAAVPFGLACPSGALAATATASGARRVRAEIVFDAAAGAVVHRLSDGLPLHPASLTKMLTLDMMLSAIESGALSLDDGILFSRRASARPATRLGCREGARLPVSAALAALAVHSCNDVATAVAEALGGDEQRFAAAMSARARAIGMASSSFANASGLPDPGNVSTARDLLLLGATVLARHRAARDYLGMREWHWEGRTFRNTNRMLATYPGMDAGKTGFTAESGCHLFATAIRGGRRVLAVVAGGDTAAGRDRRMAELLDAALA
jgi:D-alanyl-D-alanine carboxypeptidase